MSNNKDKEEEMCKSSKFREVKIYYEEVKVKYNKIENTNNVFYGYFIALKNEENRLQKVDN